MLVKNPLSFFSNDRRLIVRNEMHLSSSHDLLDHSIIFRDLYGELGVNVDATDAEIRRAYRALTLIHHPDKNSDESSREKFNDIKSAYEILADPIKRTEYDVKRYKFFAQFIHLYVFYLASWSFTQSTTLMEPQIGDSFHAALTQPVMYFRDDEFLENQVIRLHVNLLDFLLRRRGEGNTSSELSPQKLM